jgi:hypothetical protein
LNPKKVALKRRTWQGSALAGRHPHYQEDIFSFNFIFIFNVCFFNAIFNSLSTPPASALLSFASVSHSAAFPARYAPLHASPLALFPSGLALALLLITSLRLRIPPCR